MFKNVFIKNIINKKRYAYLYNIYKYYIYYVYIQIKYK